ncbi:chorion class CB protein M5H4-like [Bicyclus anynana]|uniref:Chorion class CB protein M5H4-like n=1 Tax=Bicyclus anynana TaxID=110368 RepID=A0A6J1P016_BICAN|nr:chorion class CB protein M5H4-like [Bicyclus anynana]
MYKAIFLFCASALVQTITAQCIGYAPCSAPIAAPCEPWNVPFCNSFGPASLAASNGAGLAITSRSPIAPTGVSMTSENAYEGGLAVTGAIPFLGAVALEGALPTCGGGAVTYACGNGNVAMVSEDIASAPYYPAYGYPGYPACGCGNAWY